MCVFPIIPWRKYDSQDPFLEGTFCEKFWRPIRSRALLFTPEILPLEIEFFQSWGPLGRVLSEVREGPHKDPLETPAKTPKLVNLDNGQITHLVLRHYLPVQRQILKTCHVSEKIVQNLCAGRSREVPENLCETCAGASKIVQRLCKICTAQFSHNIWGELPRICLHKFCAFEILS